MTNQEILKIALTQSAIDLIRDMKRIIVIGCPGSGKSTVSRAYIIKRAFRCIISI